MSLTLSCILFLKYRLKRFSSLCWKHICPVLLGWWGEDNRPQEGVFVLFSFVLSSVRNFCLLQMNIFKSSHSPIASMRVPLPTGKRNAIISHIIENWIVHYTSANLNQLLVICLWISHQHLAGALYKMGTLFTLSLFW